MSICHVSCVPPLGCRIWGVGVHPMSQDDDARISELCALLDGEKDSAKVLWLTEEFNRLLMSEGRLKIEGNA